MKACRNATTQDDRWETSVDRHRHQEYADWFSTFEWAVFATLSFDRELTSRQANDLLKQYLRDLEVEVKDTLSCLIVEEQTGSAGMGTRRWGTHFHLLVGPSKATAALFKERWERLPYGGIQTGGETAKVDSYDPMKSAISYVFKTMHTSTDNWTLRRSELLGGVRPNSWHTSTKTRRSIRRKEARDRNAPPCAKTS